MTSELVEWTSQVAGVIARSLVQYRNSVNDRIVVFAVDCAPWNGIVALACLTHSEVENDPMLAAPTEMAGWKHYDFASDLALGNSAKSLLMQMRRDYENAGEERAEVADSYLRACAAAVASEEVQEALCGYDRSADFRISVPHPDSNKEYFGGRSKGSEMKASFNETKVTRLMPDEPLPLYAFVPGRFPHPTSDPAGHSFGKEELVPPPVDPERWQECRPYLYGIDLFNGGFYWESHVAWESLWIACGRKGVVADFLKGLIELAAAGVKALEGKPGGMKSHSARAVELFRKVVTEKEFFMGFRIKDLNDMAEEITEKGWPTEQPLLRPILDCPPPTP